VKTSNVNVKSQGLQYLQPNIPSTYRPANLSFQQRLQKFGQKLYKLLVGSNELQVWSTTDRAGQTYWHAHDPLTNKSIVCRSEAEMVEWIENRHYGDRSDTAYCLERDQLMTL
jgi:hypothetical protein